MSDMELEFMLMKYGYLSFLDKVNWVGTIPAVGDIVTIKTQTYEVTKRRFSANHTLSAVLIVKEYAIED